MKRWKEIGGHEEEGRKSKREDEIKGNRGRKR